MSGVVWDISSPNISMAPAEPDLLNGRFLLQFTRNCLLVGPALVQLLLDQVGCVFTNITTAQLRVLGRLEFVRGSTVPEIRLELCSALVEGECVSEMSDRVVRRGERETFRNYETNG